MGNFGKEALTPDIQLTFTCFLKKRFFDGQLLHQGPEGVLEERDNNAYWKKWRERRLWKNKTVYILNAFIYSFLSPPFNPN